MQGVRRRKRWNRFMLEFYSVDLRDASDFCIYYPDYFHVGHISFYNSLYGARSPYQALKSLIIFDAGGTGLIHFSRKQMTGNSATIVVCEFSGELGKGR